MTEMKSEVGMEVNVAVDDMVASQTRTKKKVDYFQVDSQMFVTDRLV